MRFRNPEELENMARNDYIAKTGESPDHVGSFLLPDGSVYVLLESDEDGMLDQYTVDPVTGTGINKEGETVLTVREFCGRLMRLKERAFKEMESL